LGRLALEVLEQAKTYTVEGNDFVFPSSHKKKRPLSRPALGKAIHRHHKEMEIKERFTPHDLRRTVRTRLAEIGIPDVIAERVLGHKLQGLFAVYNQHSYDNEKRQAITRWEGRLSEILGHDASQGGKVLTFARKGA
jgi:integrase